MIILFWVYYQYIVYLESVSRHVSSVFDYQSLVQFYNCIATISSESRPSVLDYASMHQSFTVIRETIINISSVFHQCAIILLWVCPQYVDSMRPFNPTKFFVSLLSDYSQFVYRLLRVFCYTASVFLQFIASPSLISHQYLINLFSLFSHPIFSLQLIDK